MRLPTKPIESLAVVFGSDMAAGIRTTYFNLETFIDLNCFSFSEQEAIDYLTKIKNDVINLYERMIGEKPSVLFDYEAEFSYGPEFES